MEKDGEFGPSKLQDSSVCQLFNCSIYVTWKDSYCTVNYVTAKNSVARKSSTVCMFMFGACGDSIRGHFVTLAQLEEVDFGMVRMHMHEHGHRALTSL